MKGILYVELFAKGPDTNVHSGLAVLIQNPVWRLINALNTIWNDTIGTVLIKDWYREVTPLTPKELSIIKDEPFNEQIFKKIYGISKLKNNLTGPEIQKALVGKSTCNIACISTGYPCRTTETILPSRATVRIDFRLIPNMIPEILYQRLRYHLDKCGFQDIDTKLISGAAAARTAFHHPFVKTVIDSAREAYGKKPIIKLSSFGTGPMNLFFKFFHVPCISVGCTLIYSNIHSNNEFARIDLLHNGIDSISKIINYFSIQKSYIHKNYQHGNYYSPFEFKYT
jgi:acetylornithine deacetylase/succinyl-diaminopimelate desuccinylase-like protein